MEIHEFVGDENIFIFGDLSDAVVERYRKESYVAMDYYKTSKMNKNILPLCGHYH